MPLYNSKRDAGLVLGVNREIMHAYSSVEVAIYKIDLQQTAVNIYEESTKKIYHQPVRVFGLISREPKTSAMSDIQIDFSKSFRVGFLKSDLIAAGIYVEEGDIIEYDHMYYQIDLITEDNYWSGRNPQTMLGVTEDGWAEHGYNISIQCECHQTTAHELNISDRRTGIVESPIENSNAIPKFI